ncbi:MAG: transposase [Candidatus Omnitrophica bacterium]|nr:transposase [Candidatus Omnitrophota bacterium]
MTRPLRIEYEGAVYHVTSRGNAREPIFGDNKDRFIFYKILSEAKKKYNIICHGYCLMDNHYHLVIETPEGNLSVAMRYINGVYTQDFNRKHNRVGHIFQGRYKAILIEREEYLLEVTRYVVLNPVRAKLVKSPEQWEWSSFSGTAGKERKEEFLDIDWILGNFGNTKDIAQKLYVNFVKEGINEESFKIKMKRQNILGSDDFKQKLSKNIEGKKTIKEISKKQRYIGRPKIEDIFNILGTEKRKEKRNDLIKKAVMEYGYQQKEVARILGMHYASISKILIRKKAEFQDLTP